MPKEYFKKKGQSNRFKMRNPLQYASAPLKEHDGTAPPTKQLGVMGGDVDIVDPMLGGQVSGPIGTGIYYKRRRNKI
jgi:hypothetical protein